MKLGRTTVSSVAIACSALAGGLGVALPANAAVVTSAAHSPKFVVLDCSYKPEAKPKDYTLACADDGLGLENMHWTRWTSHGAAGHGTFYEKICTPECPSGHVEQLRVRVTLRGSAAVKGHSGDRQYTKLIAVFPGKRPTVYKREHGKIVATHPRTWTIRI
jgi:hypothetical protein